MSNRQPAKKAAAKKAAAAPPSTPGTSAADLKPGHRIEHNPGRSALVEDARPDKRGNIFVTLRDDKSNARLTRTYKGTATVTVVK